MILQTSCFHAQDILHRTRSGHLIGQLLERLVYSSLFILQSSLFMFHITSMLFQLYLKGQTLFKKGKRVLEFQYGILIIVVLAINGRTCSRSGIVFPWHAFATFSMLYCIPYYSHFAYSRFKSRRNGSRRNGSRRNGSRRQVPIPVYQYDMYDNAYGSFNECFH